MKYYQKCSPTLGERWAHPLPEKVGRTIPSLTAIIDTFQRIATKEEEDRDQCHEEA